MSRRRLHLISCRVFERELEVLAAEAKTDLRIEYLEMALHEKPGAQLQAALQAAVNAVPTDQCDAIALGYGLCNRGLVGLQTPVLPVAVPRAHDCLGLLLGSSARYLAELDRVPGTYFQSPGWIEHLPADRTLRPLAAGGDQVFSANPADLIARYGAENAQFLLEQLASFTKHYQRLAFIATPVTAAAQREQQAGEIARQQGWRFEKLPGDLGWLRRLINGDWNENEFLVLKPGEQIVLRYDGQLIGAEAVRRPD
jgi:hypothetical protein